MQDEQSMTTEASELRQFVERLEQLDTERRDVGAQVAEVYAEAKARGYSTKALRTIVALRKRDQDDIAEEDAILDAYKSALGMT